MDEERLKRVFAQQLRSRRRELGFTQEKLSEQSDIAVAQISKLERGLCCCGLVTAWRLAQALQVHIGRLVGEDDQEQEMPVWEALSQQAKCLEDKIADFIIVLDQLGN